MSSGPPPLTARATPPPLRPSGSNSFLLYALALCSVLCLLLLLAIVAVVAANSEGSSSELALEPNEDTENARLDASSVPKESVDDITINPQDATPEPTEGEPAITNDDEFSSNTDDQGTLDEAPLPEKTNNDVSPAPSEKQRAFPKFDGQATIGAGPIIAEDGTNPFISEQGDTVFVVDVSLSISPSKRERIFRALIEALVAMKKDQRFSVLFFDDHMYSYNSAGGLLKATPKNIERLTDWINEFTSGGGGTQPLESMLHALSSNPDRIVILSDGEFSPIDVQSITAENASRADSIRIDAIGLTEVVQTLQDLARKNDGIYYQAR
jgi:hypothetical protein